MQNNVSYQFGQDELAMWNRHHQGGSRAEHHRNLAPPPNAFAYTPQVSMTHAPQPRQPAAHPSSVPVSTNNHQQLYHNTRQHRQTAPSSERPRTPVNFRDIRNAQQQLRNVYSNREPQQTQETETAAERAQRIARERDSALRKAFMRKSIDLSESKKLGSGRYSKVITAKNLNSGDDIAIKVISKEKITNEFRTKFLPREIECWKRLRHPHLVQITAHYECADSVFLTMEYGPHGDLLQHVQRNGPVNESLAKVWIAEIVAGVKFMHSNGIAHRDLKCENIIMFPDGVKIGDFGFAKSVENSLSQTYCGSRSYSPPEILRGEPYSPYKADVWSVGVIVFVVVTDNMPFRESMPNADIVENQRRRSYIFPSRLTLSPECQHCVNTMLTFQWLERPNIQDCEELPWLSSAARHVANRRNNSG